MLVFAGICRLPHEHGVAAVCPSSAASDRKVAAMRQPGLVGLQSRTLGSGDQPRRLRLPSAPIPLLAALLSALVPGLGQLYAGRRRAGTVALMTTALLLLRPAVLVGLLALDLGVALLRLGCVVDAFRSAQLRRGPPPGGRYAAPLVGLAVIASVTVAPHLAAGYYDLQASRLLRSIAGAPA